MAQNEASEPSSDKTLFDYLVDRQASFADEPLGDVDATILSYASYLYFDQGTLGRMQPDERIPLPVALCGVTRANLFGPSTLMRIDGETFLTAFLQSSRFMQLEVGHYVDDLAPEQEKQFAAVTFYLPDGSAFVSFRGSDNSLAGWKENFNLSFMDAVPSQLSARAYLEAAARMHAGKLYVGGHSKGGNLAEYAALTCDDSVYQRIVGIYSLDGPGFANQPSKRIGDEGYVARLHKVVPEGSVFGMMMEYRPAGTLRIVRSSGVLFAQHVPSKWLVEENDFVTTDRLTPDADIIAGTVNTWAATYGPEQRELFFNVIFDVLRQGNGVYWSDRDGLDSMLDIAEATAQVPHEMRRTVVEMLLGVASAFGGQTVRRTLDGISGSDGTSED